MSFQGLGACTRLAPMSKCAVCNAPLPPASAEGATRQGPFCSPRCRTIDLGKWLGGEYVISRPLGPEDGEEDLAEFMLREEEAGKLS